MVIRKIGDKDTRHLIEYNIKTYGERDKIEESFSYRFDNNPCNGDSSNESLVVENEDGQIIGQALMMPTRIGFGGKVFPAYWGMDFFVDKRFRGITGVHLLKKAIAVENHFGVGLSKTALGLHLHFGEYIAGYMKKYIRLSSVLGLCKIILNKEEPSKSNRFPETLNVSGGRFTRVHDPEELATGEGFWDPDLVEFSRKKEFIKWRFLYYQDKYFVYKYHPETISEDAKPAYFVVRPIVWRKLNCLLLTDYRFPRGRKDLFEKILKAAARLSRKNRMAATLTGCSLPEYDPLLRKKLFVKLGKKMVIVSNFQSLKTPADHHKNRILVTFADSDIDFYFFSNNW
jgi:hypothetical protein